MVEPHQRLHSRKKDIIINNFIGGIAWSVGATIGLSLVLGLLAMIVKQVSVIPIVGSFVVQVVEFIDQNRRSL